MKRNHPLPQQGSTFPGGAGSSYGGGDMIGRSTTWGDAGKQVAADDDEMLALLGYKVKSSDMADVAEKIQHLDEVLENDDELSLLASDSVHCNPSDLSSWLQTMISTTQPPTMDDSFLNTVTGTPPATVESTSMFVPGNYMYPPAKRTKPSTSSSAFNDPNQIISTPSSSSPTFENLNQIARLVDSQENGVRLVHTLMACAAAVEHGDLDCAEKLVKQVGILAASQPGAMKKVATSFAEALARRIFRLNREHPEDSPAFQEILEMHFYEACPYLKFAHFTANQAILEAFEGKSRVHVIDFGIKQGIQWPALMQALAVRPGGPPVFRLTGIGPPAEDQRDHLHEVGLKLAQLADTINVKFEYRGFVVESLADLEPVMFGLRDGESVAVNSVFELHRLLARPGAIDQVLSAVKAMSPEIVTVVEQEANHNGPGFLDRFTESLHYYSALFDSLADDDGGSGCGGGGSTAAVDPQSKIMSEMYLGKQICNVVACEGQDRVERHELVTQWRTRLDSAGFEAAHLGSNAFKQASMLLAVFAGGGGFRVMENDGCLMLGWHTRPLIATSAWKVK